ncbi:MAG: ABC transporter permease [Candidatus Thermoplasmatota archaeon]|nr:ABC transporter permease [Candidatus Thermoplasmatota archaeon]
MSLAILLRDELNGFYRSKVMLFLWIGLPALAVILYFATSGAETEGIPFSSFAALLVSVIGGAISAAMLTVGIINEREKHVYDLFVIRPVKRRNIVLSKFLAVYICVVIASFAAIMLGIAVDYFGSDVPPSTMLSGLLPAIVIAVSMVAISCSAGVLIGILSPSVLVGVILVIYGANQLSSIAVLPVLTASSSEYFPLIPGAVITAILLLVAILVFSKKQL